MSFKERCLGYGISLAIAAEAFLGLPAVANAQTKPKDVSGQVSVLWGDTPVVPFGKINTQMEFVDQTQILIDGKQFTPPNIYIGDILQGLSGQNVEATDHYVAVSPDSIPLDSRKIDLPVQMVDVQCNTNDAIALPSDTSMHQGIQAYFAAEFGEPAIIYQDSPQPIQMDKSKAEFLQPNGTYDLGKIARECIQTWADRDLVTATNINLFLPADMTNGSAYATNSLHVVLGDKDREFRVGWFPSVDWVMKNRSVRVHEIGHQFGWPHSGDKFGTVYADPTSVMGDAWYKGDQYKDNYGIIPQGPRNFNLMINGRGAKIEVIDPSINSFIVRADTSIVSPLPTGATLIVECLRDDGFDNKLNLPGCVAHTYRDDRVNPAWLVSQNGEWHFKAGDSFTVEDVEVKLDGQTVSVIKRRKELKPIFLPKLGK